MIPKAVEGLETRNEGYKPCEGDKKGDYKA